jgi:hypothetical protein
VGQGISLPVRCTLKNKVPIQAALPKGVPTVGLLECGKEGVFVISVLTSGPGCIHRQGRHLQVKTLTEYASMDCRPLWHALHAA